MQDPCLLLTSSDTRSSSALAITLAQRVRAAVADARLFDDLDELLKCLPGMCPPGAACVLVVGPDVDVPLGAGRRASRIAPDLRVVFAVDPIREEALRREAVYGAPPGGRWVLVRADSKELEARVAAELHLARQQQRMRTTVDRMKLRLARPMPSSVDPGEYRRLVASDRYLASVLQHANDAIVSLDRQGLVVSWNSGAERLFGRTRLDARGQTLAAMFRDRAQAEVMIQGALAGDSHRAGLEIGGADVRYIDANFSPLSDETNGTFGAVAILRDATERHRAEEDLRANSRQKDEFLAMLAHELRNPLAPIRNSTQILQMLQGTDARSGAAIAIIARQTTHMASLLDDLLDVARVTRGAVVLERESVSTRDVLSDAVEQARVAIDSRSHRLTISPHAADPHVVGDRKRLTQVFSNLLINAAKYTPDGGHISVDVQTSDSEVEISVVDTGVGVEPDLVGSIFELFVQAKRSPDRAQGGLGVGLALVKTLVEMHGGRVRLESAGRGCGSTFTVTLPRAPAASRCVDLGIAPVAPQAGKSRLRLMVVDDNEDAARTLGAVLDAVGYEVDIETDPRVALDRARELPVDVFVLDIGMPHIDGFELARRIRALECVQRPVLIALTGYGSPSDQERARLAGFDHHLTKPVDASRLVSLLQKLGGRKVD